MTTTLLPSQRTTRTSALRARDWAHVLTPVLAGFLFLAATATDPFPGTDSPEMFQAYADNPGGLAVHALTLHFAFGLWIASGILAARLVTGRGAWIANIAVVLGFLGITTLPGLMFSDFFTSAITSEAGVDMMTAVHDRMDTMWGVTAFVLQGIPGATLAPLVGAIALGRAKVVPWWVVGVVGVSLVVALGFATKTIPGAVALIGLLSVYSWALHRAMFDRSVAVADE